MARHPDIDAVTQAYGIRRRTHRCRILSSINSTALLVQINASERYKLHHKMTLWEPDKRARVLDCHGEVKVMRCISENSRVGHNII